MAVYPATTPCSLIALADVLWAGEGPTNSRMDPPGVRINALKFDSPTIALRR